MNHVRAAECLVGGPAARIDIAENMRELRICVGRLVSSSLSHDTPAPLCEAALSKNFDSSIPMLTISHVFKSLSFLIELVKSKRPLC